ncbi:MAG: UDP-glucose--hexose-1-phosphate uridylyltransferase [Lachnospiraceae bacterium]|nr:UDP-glucose--hexose-1-phosphate uridylyltransferase [Lachnospiraceae bacterium]
MIQHEITRLVQYGLATGLILPEDAIFTANRVLELLKIDALEESAEDEIRQSVNKMTGSADKQGESYAGQIVEQLPDILCAICDYAYEAGILEENTIGYRDLFDTKVMSLLVDRPSNVIRRFNELYQKDPKQATDYYYKFSQDTDYIRRYRIAKDMKWIAPTEYGDLDITINLSKPEKDPKAIAAARNAKQSAYPKCQLCMENEGYAGRLDHPARQNHRIIPVKINGSDWFFQYSPYVYYNEHCIVFNSQHVPMKIERATFAKLLDFVTQFPHYFVGSNADLPIVGGSILSHDHFQGGHYEFAMAKAPIEKKIRFAGYEDVEAGIVKWPMSVIRIRSERTDRLIDLADKILLAWRGYTDESAFIFAETDGEPHNTITPIARKKNGKFELDLVLRNNITTEEHPLGVFHPHAELHHIKKENIGLIEVMGLAVLPARLKGELEHLKTAMVEGRDISDDEELSKHAPWVEELKLKYRNSTSTTGGMEEPICFTADSIDHIIEDEVGLVFSKVLEHAGVYKRTPEGQAAFLRFVESVR